MKIISFIAVLLTLHIFHPALLAQDQADDSATVKSEIGILIEYIKLDHKEANRLLGKFAPKSNDAQALRETLDTLIDKGEAQLIETSWLRCQSGEHAKTQSIRADMSVVSADPAEMPQTVKSKGYMTSASPTSFSTHEVGTTLEVNATISSTDQFIKLDVSPEIVIRLEDRYFVRKGFEHTARGIQHKSFPTFYTMKDTTQIVVKSGKYNLLGIHSPPHEKGKKILVLLRADLIPIK